jgi:long-chain fatty acid transport protein
MSLDPKGVAAWCRFPLVLAIVAAASGDVRADGWKVQLQGVKALGLSYAGRSIFLDDASTVWFNPAGMTRLKRRWTLTSSAPLITYRLDYTDQGSTSVLGQPLTGELTANGGRTSVVPHVYTVRKINDRMWAGFGFNAPYGLGSDYGETWAGRYHATKTELAVLDLNPALAVKANEYVSLGFGLDVQRSDTRLGNMIDFGSFGAVQGLPLTPQRHDGSIELKAGDWAVGYDLSLALTAGAKTRAGVTYRSQIEHTVAGTAHFTVPTEAAALTAGGALFKDTPASAVLPMPRELSMSASCELGPKWVLVGDVTWTDWSRFERLVVTFENPAQPALMQEARFDDSWRGAVGVIYRTTGRWELRAGGLYETTPVPDALRTPRLPEVNNTGVSGGGSYRMSERWEFDFSFSHLMPHEAPIVLEDAAAGRLTGKVRWRLDIMAMAINVRF